jgi:MYXO-CTERM domain-containing protein
MKTVFFVAAAASAVAASADAGFLGFAGFSRTIGANRVIDVVAVVSNSSDRLLNVYNGSFANNGGAGGSTFFIQQAGLSTRGFKPDAASSSRNNGVDSFCTIGVQGGAPYYGEYYASGATGPDGNFTTGWTTLGNTFPSLAGWFISPPTIADNLSESLANFTGDRTNSSAAAAGGTRGIWVAHLVMSGSTTSCTMSLTAAVKDGVSGQNSSGSASQFDMLVPVPAPGAIALVGLAGLAAGRRRRA